MQTREGGGGGRSRCSSSGDSIAVYVRSWTIGTRHGGPAPSWVKRSLPRVRRRAVLRGGNALVLDDPVLDVKQKSSSDLRRRRKRKVHLTTSSGVTGKKNMCSLNSAISCKTDFSVSPSLPCLLGGSSPRPRGFFMGRGQYLVARNGSEPRRNKRSSRSNRDATSLRHVSRPGTAIARCGGVMQRLLRAVATGAARGSDRLSTG